MENIKVVDDVLIVNIILKELIANDVYEDILGILHEKLVILICVNHVNVI